ncbi:hypothetical protein J8Z24_03060 [Pseudoalteromonas sp. SCSIO 43201]|uniref:hypothetical protein n=1 Tax=Pseudoalteromonas sp. SCSIO 43201 TaxID=2822842 RepID=UPI002075E50E|nr:hypothetical protein [Pseudoalteromonas sp. SCSIO 43201]USD29090.1 hypothetical protein J8Z24_03060 [Pseudoalteromonas sp. SCSIO 43201]
MSRYIVVGSSNVIFTHSYGIGLKEKGKLAGYIDIGQYNVEYPEYLKNTPIVKVYNDNVNESTGVKNKLIKCVKVFLKKTKLDRNAFVIKVMDRVVIHKINEKKIEEINRFFDSGENRKILFLWSTTVKKEKKVIDVLVSNNHSTLVVNTYPVRSNNKLHDFDSSYKKDSDFFNSFNRLLVPTELMKNFLVEKCNVKTSIVVVPDYLHPAMYCNNATLYKSKKSNVKKIVFLGNTNFSERTIDDVSLLITSLSKNNVKVYLQGNPEESTENLKYFTPFTYQEIMEGKLAQFMSDFDGVLVAYNNMNNARTNLSYPTRFALGLLACKPIYLEKGVFKGIEKHPSVITYTSVQHLVESIEATNKVVFSDIEKTKSDYEKLIELLVDDAEC